MLLGLIGGKDIAKYTIADIVWEKIAEASKVSFEFKIIPIENFTELCKFFWSYYENKDFIGFNIALPWKTDILNLVDYIDTKSKIYNSVNVVYKKDGLVSCSNTDIVGIEKSLLNVTDLRNKKVLILGGGGAGLPTSTYLSQKYGCNVHIYDIKTIENAASSVVTFNTSKKLEGNIYDIIINATPVGKYYLHEIPKEFSLPLDLDVVGKITHKDSVLQEMNYFPLNTQLIKFGKMNKLRVISGVDMLVYQALESLKTYTGYVADEIVSAKIIEDIKNYAIKKENELLR